MSNLSTLPKGDSAWLLRKAIERIIQQVSVLETNIGASTSGNSANTQIIFNDAGVLRGDTGLTYNKTTDVLSFGAGICYGDLTVDTSTLVVDATNDVVGIGTTTPNSYAFNDPAKLVIANTGTAGAGNTFTIASGSNGFCQIAFANGTSGTSRYNGYIKYSHSTNAMEFYTTAGTLGMTLNTAGNLVFPSGKGIDFSAKTPDGSGTVGSEVLDDYEEGTWTPVVADAASGGNVGTSTIVSATYTKIGRQVSVEFYLQAIGTAGMTAGNPLTIRGFPFSAAIQAQGSFYTYRVGRNAATVSSSAFVPASDSIVQFFCFSTNSATTDTRILVSDVVSGTSELRMSVTYFV